MGAVIGALIVAGLGLVGDYITTNITNDENRKRQEESQQWQEAMVDKQNEYNSPLEQMARYKAAGINPSTIGMASGSLASGNLSASPSAVNPIPYQGLNVSNALSNLMSAYMQGQEGLDKKTMRQVQLQKTQEEINQLKENTKLLGLNAQSQQIVNTYAAAREQYAIAEADGRIKKLFSDMNLNYKQMSYLNSQIREIEMRINEVLPAEIQKIVADTKVSVLEQDKIVAIIKDYYSDIELKGAQVDTEIAKQENLQANTENIQSQTKRYDEVTNAYLEKTGAEVSNLSANTSYSEEELYWYTFNMVSKSYDGANMYNWDKKRELGKEILDTEQRRIKNNRAGWQIANRHRTFGY